MEAGSREILKTSIRSPLSLLVSKAMYHSSRNHFTICTLYICVYLDVDKCDNLCMGLLIVSVNGRVGSQL